MPVSSGRRLRRLRHMGFGVLNRVGVEGRGRFGAGFVRFLRERSLELVEVNRPNRQDRRRFGKRDTSGAEPTARAVQAKVATGGPRAVDGTPERGRALTAEMRTGHAPRLPTTFSRRWSG
jgi:transposase